jgi:hypothetical protein
MINKLITSKQIGTFKLSSGEEVWGELSVKNSDTSLFIRCTQPLDKAIKSQEYVTGVLYDLTKVTLVDCLLIRTLRRPVGGQMYYFTSVFPHFILSGDYHIFKDKKDISAIHFTVDDMAILFHDDDAFGEAGNAGSLLKKIVESTPDKRKVVLGESPLVFYFSGNHEIFSVSTDIGQIRVSRSISYDMPASRGIEVKSTIHVSITFEHNSTFEDAFPHALLLAKYFGLLIGRPQNLLNLELSGKWDDTGYGKIKVYESLAPRYNQSTEENSPQERSPHPTEMLIEAIYQPEMFLQVMKNWLNRHHSWRDARLRFFTSFEEKTYNIDKLIRAANMFDILPDTAIPTTTKLPEDIKSAKEKCRSIFKELPKSPERDSVLGALGRIEKSSLKRKIRYRAKLLIDQAGEKFPDLYLVTDEAVNCRNHYVHGSRAKIDYSNTNPSPLFFLTDTLNFVFALSDLIECGWDFKVWSESGAVMGHPFNQYCIEYLENLSRLKTLLRISCTDIAETL